jgi:DNA replication protein DnaC
MEKSLIIKKMERLKMPGMAEMLDLRLEQALKEKWSFSNFIEMLLTDEVERRDNKQLMSRLAKSRLDPTKTMETFDFDFHSKIPTSLIREISSCAFVEKKQNIFILGPSGVGKSHLAQAFGHEACRREHDVMFYCTFKLFDWINAGRGEGTHQRRLSQAIKIPVLILDDFGLQPLNETQQEDLYLLIAERYERNSTIITSNRDFNEWPGIFVNPLLGTAALDRLIHKGVQVVIEGNSYRLAEFKKTCAKAKKMSK